MSHLASSTNTTESLVALIIISVFTSFKCTKLIKSLVLNLASYSAESNDPVLSLIV
jgi:hypothetical protein